LGHLRLHVRSKESKSGASTAVVNPVSGCALVGRKPVILKSF